MTADDVHRLTHLLAAAVRLQAVPLADLERRLGMARGRLGKILSGRAEIKVSTLLRVLAAIGVPAGAFFRQAFPESVGASLSPGATSELDAPTQLLDRLHELIGLPAPGRPGAGRDDPASHLATSAPLTAENAAAARSSVSPPGLLSPLTPLSPLTDAELDARLDHAFARFWGALEESPDDDDAEPAPPPDPPRTDR